MKTVFLRELRSYFTTMTGYIFGAFLLVFAGVYTMAYNLNYGAPNFEYALRGMSFVFMIVVPVLTMRGIAEERRQKTDQLLYAMPIRLASVVWGKYLAMLCVFLLPMLILCTYPLILSNYGTVHFGTAYGTLTGFFFMGAAFIAIGLFISSLTENQVVAAVLCFLVLLGNFFLTSLTEFVPSTTTASMIALSVLIAALALLFYSMTKNSLAAAFIFILLEGGLWILNDSKPRLLAGFLPNLMNGISLFSRFNAFVNGIFDITALVFYLAIIFAFQFFSVQALEKRRWL